MNYLQPPVGTSLGQLFLFIWQNHLPPSKVDLIIHSMERKRDSRSFISCPTRWHPLFFVGFSHP